MASVLFFAAGLTAFAGTNGQELDLHDINGFINSAEVQGYNDQCLWATYFAGWPNPYLEVTTNGLTTGNPWWWQDWYGSVNGHQCYQYATDVTGYANSNFTGYLADYYLATPHNQTGSNWYSCAVDNSTGVSCAAGLHSR
jgi:hypothetical protein